MMTTMTMTMTTRKRKRKRKRERERTWRKRSRERERERKRERKRKRKKRGNGSCFALAFRARGHLACVDGRKQLFSLPRAGGGSLERGCKTCSSHERLFPDQKKKSPRRRFHLLLEPPAESPSGRERGRDAPRLSSPVFDRHPAQALQGRSLGSGHRGPLLADVYGGPYRLCPVLCLRLCVPLVGISCSPPFFLLLSPRQFGCSIERPRSPETGECGTRARHSLCPHPPTRQGLCRQTPSSDASFSSQCVCKLGGIGPVHFRGSVWHATDSPPLQRAPLFSQGRPGDDHGCLRSPEGPVVGIALRDGFHALAHLSFPLQAGARGEQEGEARSSFSGDETHTDQNAEQPERSSHPQALFHGKGSGSQLCGPVRNIPRGRGLGRHAQVLEY
mmetsp:Transcript_26557/g.68144  ORF Transcript_26557/g.68144 Transcript_26557/m.68144 type:complete len:389 (+) Transcript_26557:1-1167(+)